VVSQYIADLKIIMMIGKRIVAKSIKAGKSTHEELGQKGHTLVVIPWSMHQGSTAEKNPKKKEAALFESISSARAIFLLIQSILIIM